MGEKYYIVHEVTQTSPRGPHGGEEHRDRGQWYATHEGAQRYADHLRAGGSVAEITEGSVAHGFPGLDCQS